MLSTSLNCHLTFCDCTQASIPTQIVNFRVSTYEDTPSKWNLTLEVNFATYQNIDSQALFNLNPEFRSPISKAGFQPDRPIQLEVTLHPNLLDHAQTAEEAAAYLQTLSQQQAEQFQYNAAEEQPAANPQTPESSLHPLLYTENWFCLSVKQQQDSGETGYTTFWNYVNPAMLNQPEASSDKIASGISDFIKDWAAANLTTATQDITTELLQSVTTIFDGFETWLDTALADDDPENSDDDESILETVIDFFTEDDWTFTKLQGQPVLQMAYQGDNGSWNCYAQARESQTQFVFYSIYPSLAPPDQRIAIAELITRANYGLTIGNFEMDFNDGEIRYKTSIDVEGDILTTELIKQLVYANVTMMDQYFPGILAVIEEKKSPMEAIAQIENPPPITPDKPT
jgi:hypothetical protein